MSRGLSQLIRPIIRRGLSSLGYELRRKPDTYIWGVDPYTDQAELIRGTDMPIIFDVGANIGQTAVKYRRDFPEATIYCFEPFIDSFLELKTKFMDDPLVKPQHIAIADVIGEHNFYVNHFSATNSLFPIDPRSEEYVSTQLTCNISTVIVPSVTLDSFCLERNISSIDILKMDIQGSEKIALKGADKLLSKKSVNIIYLELIFAPLYENQPSFHEIFEFLHGYGYRIFGFYDIVHGGEYGTLWADAIFVPDSRLTSNKSQLRG